MTRRNICSPICVTKRSKAEQVAIVRPVVKVIDTELQRPPITFLLIRERKHREVRRLYPNDLGDIEQKKVKVDGKRRKVKAP